MHHTTTTTTTVTSPDIATLRTENDAIIEARGTLLADNVKFCEQYKNLDARHSALEARTNKLHNDNQSSSQKLPVWEELLAAYEEVSAEFTRMAAESLVLTTREAELTEREADLSAEIDALEQAVGMPSAAGGV